MTQFIAFVILPFILGGLKAVKDVVKFRYSESVFPLNTKGWWQCYLTHTPEWIRKYWLLGFIPYAPFRDSWHTADFILWTIVVINVLLAVIYGFILGIHHPELWFWGLIHLLVRLGAVWVVARWVGFTLFYEVILINRNIGDD